MVAVVVIVLEAEVKSGDGEGEGECWVAAELKQTSSELPMLLFSTVIMPKRSRPEDDAVLVLASEGANGSLRGWSGISGGGGIRKCNTWRVRENVRPSLE